MEGVLRATNVQQLVGGKRKLVEVPYTASVGDTLCTMLTHNIVAVPVAAPPGHWIGAGGSMIVESDKATGLARKHYIGIVSTLDVLIHLAELKGGANEAFMLLGTCVSTIIGHSLEGLSLWAIYPDSSVLDAMEPMSKGLHRALVPLESHVDHKSGSVISPGYRMLTQTDIICLLHAESEKLHPILSQSVEASGVMHPHAFGVPANMTLLDTMKCMTQGSLAAVAILDPVLEGEEVQLVPAIGSRIVGTFSASDLRGCSAEAFQRWAREGVLRFLQRAYVARRFGMGSLLSDADVLSDHDEMKLPPLLTCSLSSPLKEVITEALAWKVHRVWVVEQQDTLVGLVSFSDILRVVREGVATHEQPSS